MVLRIRMSSCKLIICVCVLPEFISLQVACFRRFLKQTVDFCFVDDSKTDELSARIRAVCEREGYEYLRSPPHGPGREDVSCRHADTLLHGLRNMRKVNTAGGRYKYIGVFDSDLFPTGAVDLDSVLAEKDIICLKLKTFHLTYFWPGCCIWRTDRHSLEEYQWDVCVDADVRCDTGGTTHFYNKYHNTKPVELVEYKFKNMERGTWLPALLHLPRPLLDFCIQDISNADKSGIRWWCDIYTDPENTFRFFHLRDVSNWQGVNGEYLLSKFNLFYGACYKNIVQERDVRPFTEEIAQIEGVILGSVRDHVCRP